MLTATVTWLSPSYEAALDDEAEWPPHPGRLFCALVAVARTEADDAALRWLEALPPPEVHVPDAIQAPVLMGYVPTNAVPGTKSNRIARTSGTRRWYRTHLAQPTVAFSWLEKAEPSTLVTLDELARRVPYLGRSTSPCLLSWSTEPPSAEGLRHLRPEKAGRDRLRIPYPGHLDALRVAFEDGQPARTVDRWAFYGSPVEKTPLPMPRADAAYPDLVTLAFPPGVQLDGRLVLRVTVAFKAALLSRLGEEHSPVELALLHGHHDGRRRQCAVVALPFVGNRHATGDFLGVGIAVSPDLPGAVRRSLFRILGLDQDHPRLDRLVVPGLATVDLAHPDGRWTVDPQRWVRSARSWVSVLPVVLDRYPDDLSEVARFVALGCVFAGYPEPVGVEILDAPAARGTPYLRRSDLRRNGDPPRPAVHVRLRFDREVPGPVVIGQLRHLGLGLCAPEGEGVA